jgi:hypothetical protein
VENKKSHVHVTHRIYFSLLGIKAQNLTRISNQHGSKRGHQMHVWKITDLLWCDLHPSSFYTLIKSKNNHTLTSMTTTAMSSLLFTVARPKSTEFYNKTNITLSKSSFFLKETISLPRSLSLDKLSYKPSPPSNQFLIIVYGWADSSRGGLLTTVNSVMEGTVELACFLLPDLLPDP